MSEENQLKTELERFPVKDVLNIIFGYIHFHHFFSQSQLVEILAQAKKRLPPAYEVKVYNLTQSNQSIEWEFVWDPKLYKYCLFHSYTKSVFYMQNGNYMIAVAALSHHFAWIGMHFYVGDDLDILLARTDLQGLFYFTKRLHL